MALKFIDSLDDATLDAEQSSFRGGADEFSPAHALPDGVSGRLLNCMVEDNGRPRPRPGASGIHGEGETEVLVANKTLQALTYFDTPALELLFASVFHSLWVWDRAHWAEVAGYPFGTNSIIEMAQGNDILYASTGANHWFSYPGSGSTWTDLGADNTGEKGSPPVGSSIMCWHTNRMFANAPTAAVNDQIAVSAIGSAGVTSWDWMRFSFRVGRGEGQAITALVSGKGFWLMVGKEQSIYAVNADPVAGGSTSAAPWEIRRVTNAIGCPGKRAMCMFGDVLMVMARDGLREITSTDFPDTPFELGLPLSEPLQPWVERINWAHADGIVLQKHHHYLMVAVPIDGATVNSHVLVWNGRTRVWMGVWSGWAAAVMALTRFAAEGDRLVFGDTAGRVNSFQDYLPDDDRRLMDNGVVVRATYRGRSWDFGTQRNWKDGAQVEFQFLRSGGPAELVVVYDNIERVIWSVNLGEGQSGGLMLPFTLPQTLGVQGVMGPGRPSIITKSLDELGQFKEMYLEVRTGGQRVELKSLAAEAYVNTVDTE